MNASVALAKRDILVYIRDRQNVVFSLMGVLVVVMLYLLFLRSMLIDSYPDTNGMDHLVDAWVLSGILGIVPVTTCAGILQIMVEDRASSKDKDILVTPMSEWQIAAGHILSTFAIGIVMSLATLAISVAYLIATGCPVSGLGILGCIAISIPSSLTAAAIMFALAVFIRSTGAFSGLFVVTSVLIGFLTGIYMPMGTMPDAMNLVGTLIPASHMAALFRGCLASDALNVAFTGAPAGTLSDFRADMGFDLAIGDLGFSPETMVLYSLVVAGLIFAVATTRIGKR